MKEEEYQNVLKHIRSSSQPLLLVGENGSGKSRLLGKLAVEYSSNSKPVVAISNSVFHRFPRRSSHFKLLTSRQGSRYPENVLKHALVSERQSGRGDAKRIADVLTYCGFEPQILLKLERPRMVSDSELKSSLADQPSEDVLDIISSWNVFSSKSRSTHSTTVDLRGNALAESTSFQLIDLLRFEGVLRKAGLISRISVRLTKRGRSFELVEASSGELSLIASYAFVATNATYGCLILIDEPENSLHPQWQKEYVQRLLDLSYMHEPHLVLATHSPIIVSGAQTSDDPARLSFEAVTVNLSESGAGKSMPDTSPSTTSVEETLWQSFGTITPASHYLSELLAGLLARVASREIMVEQAAAVVAEIKGRSYEEHQKALLTAVEELIPSIAAASVKGKEEPLA